MLAGFYLFNIVCVGETDKTFIISAYNGKFCKIENYSDYSLITNYNGKSQAGSLCLNNFKIDIVLVSSKNSVAVENRNQTLTLMEYMNERNHAYFIENVKLKNNCITMTNNLSIYLVETGADNVIKRYKSADYEIEPIKISQKIDYLFTDVESDNAYAAVSGGIYDADNGSFIKCDVPAYPIKSNGEYYCDRNGNVYSFSCNDGFEKILSVGASGVCAAGDKVFRVCGSKIYVMDLNGADIGEYNINTNALDICASKSFVAVMTSSEVITLNLTDFTYYSNKASSSEDIEKSTEARKNNGENRTGEINKENEVRNKSHGNYQNVQESIENPPKNEEISGSVTANQALSSSVYNIYGNIINVPYGTTISKFKKNISYGEGRLVISNHKGKSAGSGKIGTGWTIEIYFGNCKVLYYTCVSGDITGEGNINTLDLKALTNYLHGNSELERYEKAAADFNDDGEINILDVYQIQEYSLSL